MPHYVAMFMLACTLGLAARLTLSNFAVACLHLHTESPLASLACRHRHLAEEARRVQGSRAESSAEAVVGPGDAAPAAERRQR